MKRHLEKAESRARWRELRSLWNEFDPIGVFSIDLEDDDGPLDEYESYCGTHMRLLEKNASTNEIIAHVFDVLEHMGLEKYYTAEKIRPFVENTQRWFQENWKDTCV